VGKVFRGVAISEENNSGCESELVVIATWQHGINSRIDGGTTGEVFNYEVLKK
jgi:hypothetical protein